MSSDGPPGAEPGAPAAIVGADPGAEFARAIERVLGSRASNLPSRPGDPTYAIPAEHLLEVATALRDAPEFRFEVCADVCGVDYLQYGLAEWKTVAATASGFSRGVSRVGASSETIDDALASPPASGKRFAVVYHLLSISLNQRLRLRVYCADDEQPIVDSVTGIWASANWFERETFDLFGILFRGHPDLRRILTDYGFIGHPFRKDFPISGNVEVRYDPEKRRVIYQPVTIDPRILVPKVIRQDNRYDPQLTSSKPDG